MTSQLHEIEYEELKQNTSFRLFYFPFVLKLHKLRLAYRIKGAHNFCNQFIENACVLPAKRVLMSLRLLGISGGVVESVGN